MYRKHFGLTHHPFEKMHNADELFISKSARELDGRLKHLIDLRGMGMLVGEAGCGKTTLVRKFALSLHPGLYKVFYIPNSTGNVMDLYKSIAWELGLPTVRSRAALYRVICAEVTRLTQESKIQPILIVDEAHLLRSDVLEDLRFLTNYEMDSENRLCLLLIGQPELRRRLKMAVHEALSQRIVMRYQMEGLEYDELPEYIKHLTRLAGTELPLFDADALEAIFQATGARPRKVNLLAHYALHSAASMKAQSVNAEHVQIAMAETQ